MESDGGSREPQGRYTSRFTAEEIRQAMAPKGPRQPDLAWRNFIGRLSTEELDRIAEGEPYCFRCGKPASSFHEYKIMSADGFGNEDAAAYVREDEGTYNPDTNRFACDACYIAIGMPAGPNGWQAP